MIQGWYVTVQAVREYMAIAGLPAQDEGPLFARAAAELERACDEARLKKAAKEKNRMAAIYEVKVTIRGRRVRLELYVAEQPRPEGDQPQLVRVREKGGGHQGRHHR